MTRKNPETVPKTSTQNEHNLLKQQIPENLFGEKCQKKPSLVEIIERFTHQNLFFFKSTKYRRFLWTAVSG